MYSFSCFSDPDAGQPEGNDGQTRLRMCIVMLFLVVNQGGIL